MPRSQDSRSISQMRNLGPACERDLNAAGIHTAQQLIDLGAEQALVKLLMELRGSGRAKKWCHAAFLYAMYGAIHDVDWREVPENKKEEFKQFTAELRDSSQFE